jgi:hypothetical protein
MAWANSVAITVDHTKVPSTQTNFPVLFTGIYPQLAWTAFGGAVTSSSGFDIIFASDSAGASPLSFERVQWIRQTGACEFCIKIPSLSSSTDTTFYILFGNAAVTTEQATPAAVWDSNFKGVWHVAATYGMSVTDSTANANSGIAGNNGVSLPSIALGKFGRAGSFNTSQAIYLPPMGLSTNFTISAWINPVVSGSSMSIFAGASNQTVQFRWNGALLQLQLIKQQIANIATSTGTWSANTWMLAVLTYDSSGVAAFYINGAAAGGATSLQTFTAPNMYIGYSSNSGENFNGVVDEVRVSTSLRSASWITTEYNNGNSPSTFYSTSLTTSSPSNPWGPFFTAPNLPTPMSDAGRSAKHQPVKAPSPAVVTGGGGSANYGYTA